MHVKSLAAATLMAAIASAHAAAQYVELALIEGELTENSPLGYEPGVGDFHYEMLQVYVSDSSLYRFTMSSDDFEPFWMLYTDAFPFNPMDWTDPSPIGSGGSGLYHVWLNVDRIYDLVFTTYNYNPTPLGNFAFLVEGPPGATFSIVPAPGASAALAVGILALRRRRTSER